MRKSTAPLVESAACGRMSPSLGRRTAILSGNANSQQAAVAANSNDRLAAIERLPLPWDLLRKYVGTD
jgi:hypothetical protein